MLGQVSQISRAKEMMQRGDFVNAAELFRRILKRAPNNADALAHLGVSEMYMGEIESGRKRLRKAQRLAPKEPEIPRQIAISCWMEGKLDEAIAHLDRALALRPGDPGITGSMADMHFYKGDYDRAMELIETVIDKPSRDIVPLSVYTKLCRRMKRFDEGIPRLRDRLENGTYPPGDRASLLFNLGQLLDAAGRYDEAWEAFSEANGQRPSTYNAERMERDIELTIRSWTPEAVPRFPRARMRNELPVFVVGMFRSGTSLVEQIIASHPRAFGAGELFDMRHEVARLAGAPTHEMAFVTDPASLRPQAVDRGARTYLSRLRKLAPWAARISDKQPFNALSLGPIALMLPGARAVHCLRDPIDTCLSCYLQNFAGSSTKFCDLRHIGHYYRHYRKLADHWSKVLDIPILDMQYEELVADQERQSRRLIEFLGLDWDDACLRFHQTERVTMTASNEQVKRPIYKSSVKRWKNYQEHLGPLIEALGPLAEEHSSRPL